MDMTEMEKTLTHAAALANGGDGEDSARHAAAMARLIGVVQQLSLARDVASVTEIVRTAARSLTGADGATFVLRDGDCCYYAEEDAIAPLWKGQRFPMEACISGWVMLNGQAAVIEDIYADPRIPADAYRPTFVKSLAMVPVRREAPIAAIGNYWSSRRQPSPGELAILQALADTTSVALENADLYQRLQDQLRLLAGQQDQIREHCNTLELFTRAMAHDLREPLRSIVSYSRIIQEEAAFSGETAEYFGYVRDGADRMVLLIDSVYRYTTLDISGGTERSPCDMSVVLDEIQNDLHPLIEERKSSVAVTPMGSVLAHPLHMVQLWRNLVGNAIIHNRAPVHIVAGSMMRDDETIFYVRDNGVGVSADEAGHIFTPFRRMTHRPDCAGMGLALCRKIVGLYGGTIWQEPAVGGGAVFCFTLPDARITSSVSQESEGEGSFAHVLIVDDREDDIEFARRCLIRRPNLKCEASYARDGKEALTFLEKSADRPVDLMLLDINMPCMDGFELLERMRADDALRDIGVIMCSGSDYGPDRDRARELGAAGYLVKPPAFEQFEALVAEVPGVSLIRRDGDIMLVKAAI